MCKYCGLVYGIARLLTNAWEKNIEQQKKKNKNTEQPNQRRRRTRTTTRTRLSSEEDYEEEVVSELNIIVSISYFLSVVEYCHPCKVGCKVCC